MEEIYFIGGSPCSGKSTIAERLAKAFAMYYFKVDDYLDDYLDMAKEAGKVYSTKAKTLSAEETWMRTPEIQEQEKLKIYEEIFEYVLQDVEKLAKSRPVITEGAAYLPRLVKAIGIDKLHYVNITPTKDFQYEHYKMRLWVPYVLEGCTDQNQAFENWMERDVLFANTVRKEAAQYGYSCILIDGSAGVEEIYGKVCSIFGLKQ